MKRHLWVANSYFIVNFHRFYPPASSCQPYLYLGTRIGGGGVLNSANNNVKLEMIILELFSSFRSSAIMYCPKMYEFFLYFLLPLSL